VQPVLAVVRRHPAAIAAGVLAVVAIAWLRLAGLGDRPMHHDESLDAWFSWRLATGQGYEYDPVYHGPLRIILTAGIFKVFGAGDLTARLLTATCGLALLATPLLIRRTLGRAGTIAAVIALAISPSLVYFARFGREDTPFVLAATVCSLAIVEYLRQPRAWLPPLIGISAAVAATLKESVFITAFIIVTYLVAIVVREQLRQPRTRWRDRPFARRVAAVGASPWWWALSLFLIIFVVSYTVFFTDLPGLWRGMFGGLRYWLGQHGVNRGSQPPSFYAFLVGGYEWPLLVLGAIGAVVALRRPSVVSAFLVWSTVAHAVIYTWAGERYPWLVVHMLVPLCLLAGLGVGCLWDAAGRVVRIVTTGALVAAAAWLGWTAVRTSHVDAIEPTELLVAVQSTDDVTAVVDRLQGLEQQLGDRRDPRIHVDSDAAGAWPLGWYLRDVEGVGYLSLADGPTGEFDALVISERNVGDLRLDPERHEVQRFSLRANWLPDYANGTPARWWDWFLHREVWNPPSDEWMWLVIDRQALDS